MDKNYVKALADGGFINGENLFAEVVESDGKFENGAVLCVNEAAVAVVAGDPPQALLATSTDKISNIKAEKGLFKQSLKFTVDGKDGYSFTLKGAKALVKFFETVEQYHLVRAEQNKDWPIIQNEIDDIIEKNHNEWKD